MKKLQRLGLLLGIIFIVGCTAPDIAYRMLEQEGYSDIEITGYVFFGCGESDIFHTGFTAKKNTHTITGVVCQGLLKGATIRLF